ncbi:Na(+)/H(+) antiporter subunit B [Microbulbifer sp. NBRC 101763]|uniref:Na+/H+ antiporter subunit B n=1 Tax=Microbulbifer TaxID=48073 RepID=UPI0003667C53|nr:MULTISPECIES: Na+/H+ antiporter subunit B [Microbulbifer]WHI51923.1 Na+/H+ antiporter subunit B [Microbulbifer sp. MLAF003]
MNSLILQTATRVLVALILVFSVYMLLRGHNYPGGGFIAGLIAASAFALFAIAWGMEAAQRALRVPPGNLAMSGVLISALSGMLAAFKGEAPFSGQWFQLIGDKNSGGISISNVLIFDIGVYLAVLGAVLTLIFALEEAG